MIVATHFDHPSTPSACELVLLKSLGVWKTHILKISSIPLLTPGTPPPLQSDAQVTPFGVNRRNLTGLRAGHTVLKISVSHCETEFYK